MLRVPMITLSIFLLRIFLMFVIQLNSSLELVLLLNFGTSGFFGGNSLKYLEKCFLLCADLVVNL